MSPNEQDVQTILEETGDLDTLGLLRFLLSHYGDRIALASSFGAEDQVLTDMICNISTSARVFTLDTGRLHQETYDCMHATREKYGVDIRVAFPDRQQVSQMVRQKGPNLFYESVENRKLCCQIRKIEPLQRELTGLDAWIVGLRREQSVTRQELQRVAWDDANGLIKFAPLIDWTEEQVWEYIREHKVPYNGLHDKQFPSIGCAPCTRAVAADEDVRAGRWWWEQPEHKECGLHWDKRTTA